MEIKNVMIAGAGTLGAQIAWQTAFKGFNVTVYDVFEKGLEQGKVFHKQFAELFMSQRGATQEEIDSTFARLKYTTNLKEAVKDADLVSESVPESINIKKDFYTNLAKEAPEKTIFTTNTSSMVPSKFVEFTGRPKKFLAFHFANGIWDANVTEVMPHPGTDQKYVEIVTQFAKDIGMIPVFIHKEQPGYIMNSLTIPWFIGAVGLLAKGIAEPEDIDKVWLIALQAKIAPCIIMDMVGLETVYHVFEGMGEGGDKNAATLAKFVKENYIDKGLLGRKTNKGFYTYPNPSYEQPDFLK